MTETARVSIAAVIWTYDRFQILEPAIASVLALDPPIDQLIVVDSASTDGTEAHTRATFGDVVVLELPENQGMGAAIARGLQYALEAGFDFVLLLEDDSRVDPSYLSRPLASLAECPKIGLISPYGAVMDHGQWHWVQPDSIASNLTPRAVDFCGLDGGILRMQAVAEVGLPRDDFFIMLVDVEYPLRLRRAGWVQLVMQPGSHRSLQAGTAQVMRDQSVWRKYYQTRNHLRMALDLRSLTLVAGFVVRTFKQVATEGIRGRNSRAMMARLRGAIDALTSRMGRTVEPE